MKNTDEARNCFVKEINQKELMSKKHKKDRKTLNFIEHFLNSVLFGWVWNFAFASLVNIPVGISSSAAGFEICAIIAGIKTY